MRRTLAEDYVLSDYELTKGDKVLLFYSSANRDEDGLRKPRRLRRRTLPQRPLRVRRAGTALLPRRPPRASRDHRDVPRAARSLPDIHSTDTPSQLASSFINGIKHLPYGV